MFYIQPPKGLITLHTLEEVVFSRLEYLNLLDNNKDEIFTGKFEYLLQGSPHDYVGHFTLRILVLKLNRLCEYWISKETLLLKRRLDLIQSRQLYRFFKTILKHVNRRENSDNILFDILVTICSFYLQLELFKHITNKHHSRNCTKYHLKINFELIPDLIETRSVDLSKGLATIYCSQWIPLLCSLFQTFLSFEMKNQTMLAQQFLADPRINALCLKLEQHVLTKSLNYGQITASNIDNISFKFPPCMEHLHLELRRKHRLSHYARFYYTLFLRECGMSLEEAVIYWKNEYSKPHNCMSSCIHDWQTNSNKFVYSIRHMYGLEGGKKEYKCPNCRSIREEIPGSNYEGGCPFKNFDADSLKSFLCKIMTKNQFDQFMTSSFKQKPQLACAAFLKIKNRNKINEITINKPVEYYKIMNLNNF